MNGCVLCRAAVGDVAAQAWDAVQAAASSMIDDGDLSSVWEAAAGDDAGSRAVSPELERAAARLAERSGLELLHDSQEGLRNCLLRCAAHAHKLPELRLCAPAV